ncbi:MAG: phosphatidate cytidylyltransferase [Flavobacteriaceae bacterium]|nr:phosphatidate cytidylyltransferase [Flavobacteriaceae bacterium]
MKELIKRTISGFVYASLFLLSLKSQLAFIILIFAFGIICNVEFSRLVNQRSNISYIIFAFLYIYFTYFEYTLISNSFFNESKDILLVFSVFVLIFLIRDLFVKKNLPKFIARNYIASTFYLSSSFVFIALIPMFFENFNSGIILGVFVLAWVNDSFAYAIGKNFGKQKLFESVSPNKTIEGFFGGLFFTCISSYAISYFTDSSLTNSNWLFISIIVSVFGTIGDLIESKYKRQAKVKDSGIILPGHGGLLDRLDSIILASPFIYLFLIFLDYVS